MKIAPINGLGSKITLVIGDIAIAANSPIYDWFLGPLCCWNVVMGVSPVSSRKRQEEVQGLGFSQIHPRGMMIVTPFEIQRLDTQKGGHV